jgi:hypothetical protein
MVNDSVVDPDLDWIRNQWCTWIRIQIRIQEEKKDPLKKLINFIF